MHIRRLLVILSVLVLAVSMSLAQEDGVPEDTVKLGFLGPVTGPAAWVGEEQVQWIRLAVEDFNEATGWNVELVEGDTQLDPAAALLVTESQIADENILGVVGPAGSQITEATQELFSEAGLVHVSAASTKPDLTQNGYNTFFRVVPHDGVQGPTAAAYLYETLGVAQLYIIDDQTSYATNIVAEAERAYVALGGEIVGRAGISQEDQDFSALVTRIAASSAEAIFFAGQVASQGALLANQLMEQGVELIFFGTDGMFFPAEFIEDADGATNGAYVSVFAPDVRGVPSAVDVVARYQENYNDDFGSFGPPAYVAAMVVLEAMQRAYENGELSRAGVLAEVAATNMDMTILGGPLAFDENGDVLDASFYVFQVQDDRFVLTLDEVRSSAAAQ